MVKAMSLDESRQSRPLPKLRRSVEFRTPDIVHRLIAVVPLGYGVWCISNGQDVTPLFWWLVLATVMFHLLVRCTPYVKLTASGLQFPQDDQREIKWNELREARNTAKSMNLLLSTGEQLRIDYTRLRSRDVQRLRQIIKSQCMALAAEAKAALERGEVFGPASTARI
jgi:hypothetical protein